MENSAIFFLTLLLFVKLLAKSVSFVKRTVCKEEKLCETSQKYWIWGDHGLDGDFLDGGGDRPPWGDKSPMEGVPSYWVSMLPFREDCISNKKLLITQVLSDVNWSTSVLGQERDLEICDDFY